MLRGPKNLGLRIDLFYRCLLFGLVAEHQEISSKIIDPSWISSRFVATAENEMPLCSR